MSDTGADLVRTLGGWLAGTGITLLELRTPVERVRLVRAGDDGPGAPPAPARVAVQAPGSVTVTAPGAGVFLDRHPLRTEKLAAPGQAVRAAQVVGLLQVGSLLLHVLAPADGIVVETVVPSGNMVGYGAALLRLQQGNPEGNVE